MSKRSKHPVSQFFRAHMKSLKPLTRRVAADMESRRTAELWPGNRLKATGLAKSAKVVRYMTVQKKHQVRPEPFRVTSEDVEKASQMAGEYMTDL